MKRLLVTSLLIAGSCLGSLASAQEKAADIYGGVAVKVAEPSDSFTVKKIGSRWTFVTPEGNAFFLLGVMDVETMQTPIDNGAPYDTVLFSKYGDRARWADSQLRRLQQWGFNTLAEYQSYYALAYPTSASHGTTVKMPSITLVKFSFYSYSNRLHYHGQKAAPDAVKDIVDCQAPVYRGYRGGNFPDVFDPNYAIYIDGMLQAIRKDPGESGHLLSPWTLGVTGDDSDELFGFGPGPEVPGIDGVVHPHLGWLALACSPIKSSSEKWNVKYADPTVHVKAALIRAFKEKYRTIQGLNSAWGSNYSSFDSDGGWGKGRGLADEDGRHTAWLGSTEGDLHGARPAVTRDLDEFLLLLARRYYQQTTEALRRNAPGKLVFSNIALNEHQGLSRKQVLQDAGESVDVINAFIRDQRILDKTSEYAGDKPITTYEISTANADSGLSRFPDPRDGGYDSFASQAARAAGYSKRLAFLRSARVTTTGAHPIVGIKWWQYIDNWAEKSSFGLISARDNPYDGQATSGRFAENRTYGDFLGPVTAANRVTRQQFASTLATADKEKPAAAAPPAPTAPEPATKRSKSANVHRGAKP